MVLVVWDVSPVGNCVLRPLCRALGEGRGKEEVWWRNAGAYAPYRPLGEGRERLPRGCELDQVTIFHRHTARYPTVKGGDCLHRALHKLANRSIISPRRHPELAFLAKADLHLTGWKMTELTDQGRKAAWKAGKQTASVYKRFLSRTEGIFTRAGGISRVIETGSYWLQGFQGSPFKLIPEDQRPRVNLTIPEDPETNSTLSVHKCTAFETVDPAPGVEEQIQLNPLRQPIADRLNNILRPQPPLDGIEVSCLADMCAYDSQISGVDWKGWSKWCGMFTREEWEILGYRRDVGRYYGVGQGSKYGSTMGAGYVRELVARLTDSTPLEYPTINSTLASSNLTFPRGGKRLFVDFSHDNEMVQILSAMHVLNQHNDLPKTTIQDKRSYVLAEIIPFGAKVVFERISCDMAGWEPDPGVVSDFGDREKDGRKDYVRIWVNDALQTVDDVNCKQSGLAEHGMCELDLFIDSQSWALTQADWGICATS
ncbi:hypothetical protein TREMEDRAFT_67315 [Tremella mesenterica DSM 1558]|uniref:uncharacterized protein n=1 Tax=Tremella mesenterica (strain ATCC 24925 / CBS 8224 / DSM 1558 / NBRC 9311 / NRRL Y-6157 / RJB 2259-6 / UBC 559-6) TaxID=578456 RepID=UPI0003F4A421|nr:uncharacterized protein TREMEDRAFT_67315 [Tremella mesenterica DSM 1558]EIW73298.1 hypothetical protein TREMEDRAFT_67315 [Tremella mesenterica DSM 1558]